MNSVNVEAKIGNHDSSVLWTIKPDGKKRGRSGKDKSAFANNVLHPVDKDGNRTTLLVDVPYRRVLDDVEVVVYIADNAAVPGKEGAIKRKIAVVNPELYWHESAKKVAENKRVLYEQRIFRPLGVISPDQPVVIPTRIVGQEGTLIFSLSAESHKQTE